jgi:hypothetical protein
MVDSLYGMMARGREGEMDGRLMPPCFPTRRTGPAFGSALRKAC